MLISSLSTNFTQTILSANWFGYPLIPVLLDTKSVFTQTVKFPPKTLNLSRSEKYSLHDFDCSYLVMGLYLILYNLWF